MLAGMPDHSNERSNPSCLPLTRWQQVQLGLVWMLVAGVFAAFITLALQAQ